MAQLADWSFPTSEVCGSNPAIDNFDRNNSSLKNALISLCLDLAKIHNFGKSLRVIGQKLTVYLLSGKMLSLRWQISDIKGLIVIVANGQIL